MGLDLQNKIFQNTYLKKCGGNTYEAIALLSQDASEIRRASCNLLSAKEALTYCLLKVFPKDFCSRKSIDYIDYEYFNKYLTEALTLIDDEEIKLSIIFSLEKSRFNNRLEFVYKSSLSSGQKARVRIVCRLIWYNVYLESW